MIKTEYIVRNCPSCNSPPPEKPEVISEIEAEKISFSEVEKYWVGLFKKKCHFNYYRCKTCDLLFNKYYFTNQQLNLLYSNLEPNMSDVATPLLLKTQRGYAKIMKAFSNQRGNYLEIGPDIGLFLESDKESLIRYNSYYLYEPNISVHNKLKKLLHDKNLYLSKDMLGYDKLKQGVINDIVMIHVFDHIVNPLETAQSLYGKLTKGGSIMIVTHNEASFLRKMIGQKWPPFCLQHPQIYNENSIKYILKKSGLSVEYIGKTKNYFSINYLLKHFLWLFKIRFNGFKVIENYSVGLTLGNIITIGIKK